MVHSEDEYLRSATRVERFLESLDTKNADEARWIYHRVIEIAVRPYAHVVAGFVMMLFSARVTGIWLRDAADPCELIMLPLIGACAGAGISYLWNLRWYDRLNAVFDRRPGLFEDLIEFSLDDPAIARPMARLVKDRAALACGAPTQRMCRRDQSSPREGRKAEAATVASRCPQMPASGTWPLRGA